MQLLHGFPEPNIGFNWYFHDHDELMIPLMENAFVKRLLREHVGPFEIRQYGNLFGFWYVYLVFEDGYQVRIGMPEPIHYIDAYECKKIYWWNKLFEDNTEK